MITHLVAPEAFAGAEVEVADRAYRHLFRARRLAVGAQLRLVDGQGHARWAEVARVDRERAVLTAGGPAPTGEPTYRLQLVVAALRPERASWLVEKATETGASAVRFLASARTPRSYGAHNLERLRRVARAALEQCHRSRLPELSGVHPWREVADLLAESTERWYLDAGARSHGSAPAAADSGSVLVGPEGGWSEAEREELERLSCAPVGLGPRVLRVETAALAAATKILLPGWD
ncbi:MAG: 16S rRNA (uracil(1498)-N(3))-methyltransferase [bacterium]|nr:16S rRNA (uracil(1498)-N(3))-methyltransferase [bacterium]